MMKIKISYETPQELEEIKKRLQGLPGTYKIPKADTGKFRRVYVMIPTHANRERL